MTIPRKIIISGLIIATVFSCASLAGVYAQSTNITSQQVEKIRSSCTSTKNTLSQLHASDALLRVNRGQAYESIQTKLMDRFNSRIASNKIENDSLSTVTTNYGKALDKFRLDYKQYEEDLASALNIDCSSQPSKFYDAVSLARLKRSYVHNDVTSLNRLIDEYQSSLAKFQNDYKTAARGISQ